MPTLNYFPALSLLLALGLSQSIMCQEPLPAYLYPVHPNCLDSTGTAVQQKQCTEATLREFFIQHVDWSKTSEASWMARFYLNINKNGELNGYGIRSCRDAYLAKRFLEIAESLPLQNWLPSIKNGEPQDARVMLNLKWYNHQLDSVWVDGLKIHAPAKRRMAPLELIGDGSEFPDGHEAFARYLNYAIELPQDSAVRAQINGGKLSFRLWAERSGRIIKIETSKPLHPLVDTLVVEALRKGPKWYPGSSNGSNQIRIAFCTLVFRPYLQNTGEEIPDRPINPSFPNGSVALSRFLNQHITPLIQSMKPEEVPKGIVPLQLFLNPDGSIYHARILKNHHPLIDRGILEMVKKMPKWDMYRDRVRPKKSIVDLPIWIKVE